MQNQDPSKTEKPTDKRITDARNDGNVMKSEEVIAVSSLMVGMLVLLLLTFPAMRDAFHELMLRISRVNCMRDWTDGEVASGVLLGVVYMAKLSLPAMLAICFAAFVATRAQMGAYFSLKPLEWKFDQAFKPNFKAILPSKDNFVKLFLTTSKMSVIAFFVYTSIANDLPRLVQLPLESEDAAVLWILKKILFLTMQIIGTLTVLAAIDYVYRKQKYETDLMMTKEEVKDERKNSEGNPQVKAAQKRAMLRFFMNLLSKVPHADVVITNPTHVAVALKYQLGDPAPRVLAKGLRKRALRIKQLARAHGIPIVENKPLARSLYRSAKINGYIPPQFFAAVAAVLAQLHRSGLRKFKMNNKAGA